MRTDTAPRRASSPLVEVIVLLTAAALVASFVAMRYAGLWGDSDNHVFARAIRAMVEEARLVPDQFVYANGYGFPALATFLIRITGLTVAQVQLVGGMLLGVWVVLPAWLAYRELTGSARGATLATVIVFVQPEFLFPILRGSHEKFTRGLMFLGLYLLVRSVLERQRWRRFTALLLAFYLTIYALITFNNLFATSFITALALSLLLSLVVRRLILQPKNDSAATRRRLLYAVGTSLLIAFFFTFYAYMPARYGVLVVESIWDRLAILLLDVEGVSQNPYMVVGAAWVSMPVYFLVTIANWLLLILSSTLWAGRTVSWWRNRAWPDEPRAILLWSLYGAFGFLGAFSIVVDFSGALGSNLQHRVFPSFAMIAAAVVADWFVGHQALQRPVRRPVYGALVIGIAFLGIVAVAKTTNEPSLSNTWQYYSIPEKTALLWGEHYLAQQTVWVGLNERIPAALGICCPDDVDNLRFNVGASVTGVRDYLISDIVRTRAQRVDFTLPIQGDSLRIYTNGQGDIFHLRPKTPFQK